MLLKIKTDKTLSSSYMKPQFSLYYVLWAVGGSWRTQDEPTQTEHVTPHRKVNCLLYLLDIFLSLFL